MVYMVGQEEGQAEGLERKECLSGWITDGLHSGVQG